MYFLINLRTITYIEVANVITSSEWKWNLAKQNNQTLEDWYDTLRGW
jgi:hypothetical protein